MVWALFISKRDQPHRTGDWFVSSAARRQLVLRLRRLPWLAARRRRPGRRRQRFRLPCREDCGSGAAADNHIDHPNIWPDCGRNPDHDHGNKFDWRDKRDSRRSRGDECGCGFVDKRYCGHACGNCWRKECCGDDAEWNCEFGECIYICRANWLVHGAGTSARCCGCDQCHTAKCNHCIGFALASARQLKQH